MSLWHEMIHPKPRNELLEPSELPAQRSGDWISLLAKHIDGIKALHCLPRKFKLIAFITDPCYVNYIVLGIKGNHNWF